jgi:hypothetical protein
MVYNDFTVDDLTQKLALRLMDVANLFVGIVPRPAGPVLKAYLEESA